MNDGGPAFPSQGLPAYSPEGIPLNPWSGHGWAHEPKDGMTLRDYFAAKAMQGLLSASPHVEGTTEEALNDAKILACHSYVYADAMLAAREKQK